jgi:hypothetical protein
MPNVIRKAARASARDERQNARQYRTGAKLVARGDRQGTRTATKISKSIAQHKSPSKSLRFRNLDASAKVQSGKRIMSSAAASGGVPKKKTRIYRNPKNM